MLFSIDIWMLLWQHWDPTSTRIIDDAAVGSDSHDEDGEELAAAEQVAALAGPVHRKERKGVDLSQWRELVPSKDSSNGKRIRESSYARALQPDDVEDIYPTERRTAKQESVSFGPVNDTSNSMSSDLESAIRRPVAHGEFAPNQATILGTDASFRRDSKPMFSHNIDQDRSEIDDAGNIQGNLSLESQIDTENLARLQGMSPDEIAEAQAEIIDKMVPALVEVLKRRGIEKLKKKEMKKKNLLDVSMAPSEKLGSPTVDIQSNAEVSSHLGKAGSHLVAMTSTKCDNSTPGIVCAENEGPRASILWSAWSDRVEGVRNLRFSLDGNIVETVLVPLPEASKLHFLPNPFMQIIL